MNQREKPTKEEKTVLLKEYELCQDAAQSLESTIWQTSAAIGIGSIGAFIVAVNGGFNWLTAAIVGGVIVAINFIWWGMAQRWWSIQHTKFCRMRHIEKLVGLYQIRYLDYLDALLDPKRKELVDDLKKELLPSDDQIYEDLGKDQASGLAKSHRLRGVQATLKCFLFIHPIAWGLYVCYMFCIWVIDMLSCISTQ
jgi:hypothetical protein